MDMKLCRLDQQRVKPSENSYSIALPQSKAERHLQAWAYRGDVSYRRCEQCDALLREYRAMTEQLVAASVRVADVAKSLEFDAFERVWKEAQAALSKCTRLRAEFSRHMEDHPR